MSALSRMRLLLLGTLVPLLIVVGVLVGATLGGGGDQVAERDAFAAAPPSRGYTPAGSARIDVGQGARGAAIFRRRGGGASADAPVVLFLHGWAAVDPRAYGAWIGHLARSGATVIYPTYQAPPFLDTVSALANTLAAVATAVRTIEVPPGRLVVAGHSAGGALAADYAASAPSAGLPVPAAVFSVYPGRSLPGIPLVIPEVSARNISAGTRVLGLGGERDRLVGSRVAHQIARQATQADVTLRIVRDNAVDRHAAPTGSGAAARKAFWAPLDRLIAR